MKRVAITIVIAILFASAALLLGVLGYHFLGGLPWVDAILNASMILGGMGPVNPPATKAAKLFASAYALFSGLVFIAVFAVVIAPFAHRLMHRFHIDEEDVVDDKQ